MAGHHKWSEIKKKSTKPKEFKLFLDDVRDVNDIYPGEGGQWVLCRTIEEVQLWLKMKGVVTHLSLDGDMGQMEDEKGVMRDIPGGVELMDWMRATGNWPTVAINVHSQNPVKARIMREAIASHFKTEDDLKEYTVE